MVGEQLAVGGREPRSFRARGFGGLWASVVVPCGPCFLRDAMCQLAISGTRLHRGLSRNQKDELVLVILDPRQNRALKSESRVIRAAANDVTRRPLAFVKWIAANFPPYSGKSFRCATKPMPFSPNYPCSPGYRIVALLSNSPLA